MSKRRVVYERGDYRVAVWPNWSGTTTQIAVRRNDDTRPITHFLKDSPDVGWVLEHVEHCKKWVNERIAAEMHNERVVDAALEVEEI